MRRDWELEAEKLASAKTAAKMCVEGQEDRKAGWRVYTTRSERKAEAR